MTLLNGLLAFGALAFTIPLAIHLLFRSRFKTVQWGAMHLLDAIVRTNQRRLQITELLLLLVRCAIPILLAFALARPVLTGFRALPGDAAQSIVIAIDDSRSMSATSDDGQTAMQRGIAAISDYLSHLSRRDEVMLIRSSEIGSPVSTMGRDDALRKISDITPRGNNAQLDALIRGATTALADAAHAQRRIVVVTDMRSSDVTDAVLDNLAPQQRVLAAMEPAASVAVLDVGNPAELPNNLFVEAIAMDSQVAVKGRELRLLARVRNDTDRFGNDVGVTWSINGQPIQSQRIAVQPRSSTTTRLAHTFESSGVHAIRVSVEWPDALLADNQRQIAIRVMDGVQVLLVDGETSKQPLEGETDFLAIALSPFGFGGSTLPDAVRSRTIKADRIDPVQRITEELTKNDADVVVLANVRELSQSLRSRLAEFVESGRSLVIFDGNQLQQEQYNAKWISKDAEYILPAELGKVLGNPKQRESARIVKATLNQQFAPWSSVLPQSSSALDDVDVYAYRELVVRSQAEGESTGQSNSEPESPRSVQQTVLLQTTTGVPLGILAPWGRGRVVQFAISADGEWTSLPLRPVFLPLMQQLVIDLAGGTETPNVFVGETMRVPLSEFAVSVDAASSKATSNATFTIEPPVQKELPIEVSTVPGGSEAPHLVHDTRAGVGVYAFRQMADDSTGETVIRSTLRVAEVDPEESQLRPAGGARGEAFASRLGATMHTDIESLVSNEKVDRFGREIWRWILAFLLAALVLEIFLQQQRLVKPRNAPSVRTMVS